MNISAVGVWVVAMLTLIPATAQAEKAFNPAARARVLAPFLDEHTVAVIHVDVKQISLEPSFDLLKQVLPEAQDDLAATQAVLSKGMASFQKAGGREFYVVFTLSLPLIQEPIFAIVPLSPGTEEKELRKTFQAWGLVVERSGDVLLLARYRPILDKIKATKPASRPELVAAFEAAGDTTGQVVLMPPAYSRRVIEEILPQLPREIGNGPSSILTRGIFWAALGIDLPPRPRLKLVVKSQDAEAAKNLRGKWEEAFLILGRRKEIHQTVPTFLDHIAPLFKPTIEKDRLTLVLSEKNKGISNLIAAVAPGPERALQTVRMRQSSNNLKQIALAMHSFWEGNKHLPAPATYSKDGKPLLSWRVLLLPYLGEDQLFKQFHLNETWDSPHNKALIPRMPKVYRAPTLLAKGEEGRTSYVFPVGPGTAFPGREAPNFPLKGFPDGTSNTIMVLEVHPKHAVIWTKPEDFLFDPKQPHKGLGGLYKNGFMVGMWDGSTRFVPLTISPETLRNAINPADGNVLGPDW